MLGLRLGLEIGEGWEVVAFGRNLTDEDSIALATRWFDRRHGLVPAGIPPAAGRVPPAGVTDVGVDAGAPRSFFAALRKGRTFGIELRRRF